MAENIRPYIVINGKSSREISGLLISSLPPITKPQMRVTAEEIDGRDGDIVTELGFSAYDKPVEIGLAGDYDINEVISYFNQAGVITFSNEPDKYYKFAQYNGIDFEKLIRFKKATVIFHVQPFKYDTESNDAVFWNPENISITNEGNIYSKPELAIQGSGNVGIALNGSEVLSLKLGETKQAIIIDTDKMNAYGTKSNVKELITDITPVQDLHGYDSVWVGGAGKNLLNYDAWKSGLVITRGTAVWENNGVTLTATANDCYTDYSTAFAEDARIPMSEGETITLSWEESTNKNGSIFIFPNGVAGSHVSVDNARVKKISYTATSGVDFITFRFGVAYSGDTISYKNIQIEKGSTATAWTPYENICEINGWNGCVVSRTGVNLWDEEWELGGIGPDGNNLANTDRIRSKNFISVKPNLSVFLNYLDNRTISFYICEYDINKTFIQRTVTPKNSVFTTSYNCYFIRFFVYSAINPVTTYGNDISINYPSSDTEYHAYNGQTATIDFGQTVVGGTLNVTTGLLTVTHLLQRIGDLIWYYNSTYEFFSAGLSDLIDGYSELDIKSSAFKNIYGRSNANMADAPNGTINHLHTSVKVKCTNYTDATAFKTALANETIWYKLATSIEIQLTAQDLMTLIGKNNIMSNTGDISECIYTRAGADVTTSGAIVSFEADASDLRDDILKNRLVTGNYDNLRLKAGSNQIGITGDVAVLVLSNFSRWL